VAALRCYCVGFARFCAGFARPLRITQNADGGGFMEKFLWIKKQGNSRKVPRKKKGVKACAAS